MNKLIVIAAGAMIVTASACSKKSETEQTSAAPAAQTAAPAQAQAPAAATQAAPAAQGAMPADAMHQQAAAGAHPAGMPMGGAMQQAPAAGGNGGEGKVVSTMHASSYTYMEIDTGGKKVWIATNAMQVNNGDKVKWNDAAVMKNFTSNSLHRTFDEILFVSAAQVVK